MSTDAAVTKELMETLEDGKEGYAKGAEKLEKDGSAAAATFRRYAEQRATFYAELQQLAREYGDQLNEGGTVTAAVHRGWLSLKDALAGSSAKGVLGAAQSGEEHAVKEYEKALAADISPTLKAVVERQLAEVRTAKAEIARLHEAA